MSAFQFIRQQVEKDYFGNEKFKTCFEEMSFWYTFKGKYLSEAGCFLKYPYCITFRAGARRFHLNQAKDIAKYERSKFQKQFK